MRSQLRPLPEAPPCSAAEDQAYQERPERFEYSLTDKGLDLWPVLVSLAKWGDRHAAPDGPPMLILHRGCGGEVNERFICQRCGEPVEARSSEAWPGPGSRVAAA